MPEQQTTSRKKEDIEKELTSAKKLLETARNNFKNKAEQVKSLEQKIQENEAYLKSMKGNTVANHKVAGEKSRYERVQEEVARDKKRLEEMKAQRKQLGKEVANKKYYVTRLNNEMTLPFKEVKAQVKDDSQKGNKAKVAVKNQAKTKTQTKTGPEKAAEVETKVQPVNLADMPKVKLTQDPKPLEAKDVKLKITPTITLVPHVKKNGKVSSHKVDIQLMDADGKVFKLTKKMVNDAFEKGETNCLWQTYVAAHKKGKLKPEMLEETFFKGQANLGEAKAQETQQPAKENNEVKLEVKNAPSTGRTVETKDDAFVPAPKVEETTKDTNKEKPKTKTITPDGVMYSIDANGGIDATKTAKSKHLMPKYNSDNKETKDGTFHAYEKDGQWHCGNSSAKSMDLAVKKEEAALATLAANNSAYNDLKRESAKRDLTPEEKKFMSGHEAALQERGLKRCNDGVLERNTTKEADYDKNAHEEAKKLSMEIARGEKKSKTFTVKQTEANANVMQQQKGNSI